MTTDDVVGVPTYAATTYHALTPARILDTRNAIGLSGPSASHNARAFQVTGFGGVPAGATAVTGNLTVTAQTSGGYLYIGPTSTNYPLNSTLNFPVGDDRANGVTVALASDGSLWVTYVAPVSGPTAHILFDVTGYFTPDTSGATYHALAPARILDTRNGTGLSGALSSHTARTFTVTGGTGGVPSNATAVTGNLTVTGQGSGGYFFVGPIATDNPTSSTINFPVGDDRANGVTVALGTKGSLSITFVAPGPGPTAHAIFDVTGYFTADASGAKYVPLSPRRILDTRSGTGLSGGFGSHAARTFGVGGVAANTAAVTGNLTVTSQTSIGYLYIGPGATDNPTSSTAGGRSSQRRDRRDRHRPHSLGHLRCAFIGADDSGDLRPHGILRPVGGRSIGALGQRSRLGGNSVPTCECEGARLIWTSRAARGIATALTLGVLAAPFFGATPSAAASPASPNATVEAVCGPSTPGTAHCLALRRSHLRCRRPLRGPTVRRTFRAPMHCHREPMVPV